MKSRLARPLAILLSLPLLPCSADLFPRDGDAPTVKAEDCPAAVQKTLKSEAADLKIEQIIKEQGINGYATVYLAAVRDDRRAYSVVINEDGSLIRKEAVGVDTAEIKLADCPAIVQKTILREAAGTDVKATRQEAQAGQLVFHADVTIDGTDYEITVAEDGTLISKGLPQSGISRLKFSACPDNVKKVFLKEAPDAVIKTLTVVNGPSFTRGLYTAHVSIKGKNYRLTVESGGNLVEKVQADEEKEVAMADCPAAVQATFQAETEAADLKHGTFKKSDEGGRTVYRFRPVGSDRGAYTLTVAADGTLLKKSSEPELH